MIESEEYVELRRLLPLDLRHYSHRSEARLELREWNCEIGRGAAGMVHGGAFVSLFFNGNTSLVHDTPVSASFLLEI